MSKFMKILMVVMMVMGLGYMVKYSFTTRELTPCVLAQKASIEQNTLAAYPQCNFAGAYFPQQCSPMDRSCWCVDLLGHKINGTDSPAGTEPDDCLMNNIQKSFAHWQMPMSSQVSSAAPAASAPIDTTANTETLPGSTSEPQAQIQATSDTETLPGSTSDPQVQVQATSNTQTLPGSTQ